MEGARLLQKLRLTNCLSYGPEGEEIELQPLNVLIGPNGSGKSNLIDAISILKAAPTDIAMPIRFGGGISEWFFRGGQAVELEIGTVVSYGVGPNPLRYRCRLGRSGHLPDLLQEDVEQDVPVAVFHNAGMPPVYAFRRGAAAVVYVCEPVLPTGTAPSTEPYRLERSLKPDSLNPGQSVLSQLRDPNTYPELTYLAKVFSEIGLFRGVSLGRASALRGPQRADETAAFLLEDGRNLGVVLNGLLSSPSTKKRLVAELRRFYPAAEDMVTKVVAGTVETLLHERDMSGPIPSTRLSDGTLRYLSLLCVLLHQTPPGLICIEEPEIGLHPDALPHLADLLVEASERMQLIVTTHSDILVSALSDVPEAVVVCERDDRGSHLRRLDAGRLQEWLKKYSLGELCVSGEIGGNP